MSSKNKKSSLWEFFQSLGKTFMLPVALLAFMGLVLGIGSAFTSPSTMDILPFLNNSVLQAIFGFMASIGGFAFTYLPAMFAMAIPLGLCRTEKGVAGFAGFVGYVIMHMSINFYLTLTGGLVDAEHMRTAGQAMVMGIQTIEMGVLGGIITGIIVYKLHTKFIHTQLPDAFGFFGGQRFVPIITALVMSVVGLIIPAIWPLFAAVINGIGLAIQKTGVFGPFLFAAGERALLPFGLHHILVAMIRFTEAGGTQVVDGQTVSGALNIFYAQLRAGAEISPAATAFLSQGKMPTFIFGLPGVACAIYKTARPENRKAVKGLLISGIIASAVTGITEPIEFLFLFVSPMLYVFHAFMTGLGFMVMSLLQVTIGNTDGGLLDFFIFGVLQGTGTKWPLVVVVGIVWFLIYYHVFKFVIEKKNLMTPGRAILENEAVEGEFEAKKSKKQSYDAAAIMAALGGKDNIDSLDNCVTRLRMVVKDMTVIDDNKLKSLGAIGVIRLDEHNIQVVIGTKVAAVKAALEQLM